jgi:GDSL-like Lipase/Acylhydrolase family
VTRSKFIAFASMAMLLSLGVTTLGLLAADLYAHSRVERSVGVNRRGYRGPTIGRKQNGERRVVMLGGSTVFGWDVAWEETIPAVLEVMLHAKDPQTRVINLGFIGEGAYAFLPTLQDFSSLDYDVAILYEGYNDLLGDSRPNTDLSRHGSPVFRATGYFPILPLVLTEKAKALRFGNVGAAYKAGRGEEQTVFKPGLASRTSAAALEAAANVTASLGRQLDRMSGGTPVFVATGEAGCASPWVHYCESVYVAAKYALSRGKTVLVVAQPLLKNDRAAVHESQQQALAGMVSRKFSAEPRVRYVDLRDAVDLSNQELAFDGMHLNLAGNTIIAKALLEPVATALLANPEGLPPPSIH